MYKKNNSYCIPFPRNIIEILEIRCFSKFNFFFVVEEFGIPILCVFEIQIFEIDIRTSIYFNFKFMFALLNIE